MQNTRETISQEYLAEQQKLHENPNYGVASTQFAPIVAQVIKQMNATVITDYGAGKKRLATALAPLVDMSNIKYQPYDPAFPDYGDPTPAPVVCCIDVLEHIEPDLLDNVLAELAELTDGVGFFTIHTGPAGKTLSDGRNAHLIQENTSWWLPRLSKYFELSVLQRHNVFGGGFFVVVERKKDSAQAD